MSLSLVVTPREEVEELRVSTLLVVFADGVVETFNDEAQLAALYGSREIVKRRWLSTTDVLVVLREQLREERLARFHVVE